MRIPTYVVACAFLSILAACTPERQYRYTGYVPASHPFQWDGRTTPDGHLRVEGSLAHAEVVPHANPRTNSTGVFAPETTAQASLTVGAEPARWVGLEGGVRLAYSNFAWSQQSALGTMRMPDEPSLWGVGLDGRATFYLDRLHLFGIGVGFSWMAYDVPFAKWSRGCNGGECTVLMDGTSYGLSDQGHELHLFTFQFALYPSIGLGENAMYGHVFGGIATTTGYTNWGFAETGASMEAVREKKLVPSAVAGYGVRIAPVHLAVMLFQPLTDGEAPIDYKAGGIAMLGVDFEVWKRRKTEPKPAPEPVAPAPTPPPSPSSTDSTQL